MGTLERLRKAKLGVQEVSGECSGGGVTAALRKDIAIESALSLSFTGTSTVAVPDNRPVSGATIQFERTGLQHATASQWRLAGRELGWLDAGRSHCTVQRVFGVWAMWG
jgi:hypothetical protein